MAKVKAGKVKVPSEFRGLALQPSSALLRIALDPSDPQRGMAAVRLLLDRDVVEILPMLISELRRASMEFRRKHIHPEQLLIALMDAARIDKRPVGPILELLFTAAAQCLKLAHDELFQAEFDTAELNAAKEVAVAHEHQLRGGLRPQGLLLTTKPLLQSGQLPEDGANAVNTPNPRVLYPRKCLEQLAAEASDDDDYLDEPMSPCMVATILLEACAKHEQALRYAEQQLSTEEPFALSAACRLFCMCAGFDHPRIQELIGNALLADTLASAAREDTAYLQRTTRGQQLRQLVVACCIHEPVRRGVLRLASSNCQLSASFYARREVVAEQVFFPLLRYGDTPELAPMLAKHYPAFVSLAVTALADETLADGATELLLAYGESANRELLAALQRPAMAERAAAVLVRIGPACIPALLKLAKTTPAVRPLSRTILAAFGDHALEAVVAELGLCLKETGELAPALMEVCPNCTENFASLLKMLAVPALVPVVIRLLQKVELPPDQFIGSVPSLALRIAELLDDPLRRHAAAKFLLLSGSDGVRLMLFGQTREETEALLEELFADRELQIALMSCAVADNRIGRRHATAVLKSVQKYYPVICTHLQGLCSTEFEQSELFCFMAAADSTEFDYTVLRDYLRTNSPVSRKLLLAFGFRTLRYARHLLEPASQFAALRNDSPAPGEALLAELCVPKAAKFPWFASLLAGANLPVTESLLRLIAPLAQAGSVSVYRQVLRKPVSAHAITVVLDGVAKLSTASRSQVVAELEQTVQHPDTHIAARTARVLADLDASTSTLLQTLTARRRQCAGGSALHQALNAAIARLR